jgi:hypothetical protein
MILASASAIELTFAQTCTEKLSRDVQLYVLVGDTDSLTPAQTLPAGTYVRSNGLSAGGKVGITYGFEQKGYIERKRSESDERNLIISITKQGEQLREEALRVPSTIGQCVKLEPEEAKALYDILYKILRGL